VQQTFGPTRELSVIAIEPSLENLLVQALAPNAGSSLEPGVAEYLLAAGAGRAQKRKTTGTRRACWCPTAFACRSRGC